MGLDSPWHWLVVIAVVAVLFGYKKLPDASRSLGRSLRIFKTEIRGLSEDDKARDAGNAAVTAPAEPTQTAQAAQATQPAQAVPPATAGPAAQAMPPAE